MKYYFSWPQVLVPLLPHTKSNSQIYVVSWAPQIGEFGDSEINEHVLN